MHYLKVIIIHIITIASLNPLTTSLAEELSAEQQRSFNLNEQGTIAAQSSQFNQAEDLFKEALLIDPYNLTAVFNLAGVYAINKKEGDAKKLLEQYISKVPDSVELHARLADVYFSLATPEQALTEYKKTLELDPSYQGIYPKIATIYLLQNRSIEAEQALKKAVEESPQNSSLLKNLTAVLISNSHFGEAIEYAKRTLQVESSAETYLILGNAYEFAKDKKNALIAYQRAYNLGNNSKKLAEKIKDLSK